MKNKKILQKLNRFQICFSYNKFSKKEEKVQYRLEKVLLVKEEPLLQILNI